MYWDGGLFDNTPLSSLLGLIDPGDAASTRVHRRQPVPEGKARSPRTMLDVFDRMTELQFANKTEKDVTVARKINKLVAVIEELQGVPAGDPKSVLRQPEFADLAKYRVFENIIAISNNEPEPVSSSADFSMASIERRIEAGYRDAKAALTHPPEPASHFKQAVRKSPEDCPCPSR